MRRPRSPLCSRAVSHNTTLAAERDGVTMVMVTHDVSLKPLAKRVVHMLDGKLQRIETIPDEARAEMMRGLRERIASTMSVAEQTEDTEPPRSIADCKATVVRRPADYGDILAVAK